MADEGATDDETTPWVLRRAAERRAEMQAGDNRATSPGGAAFAGAADDGAAAYRTSVSNVRPVSGITSWPRPSPLPLPSELARDPVGGAEGRDRDASPRRRKVRGWMFGVYAVAWFWALGVTAPELSEQPSDAFGAVLWVGFWGLVLLTVMWFGFRRVGAGILNLLKAYWNAIGD